MEGPFLFVITQKFKENSTDSNIVELLTDSKTSNPGFYQTRSWFINNEPLFFENVELYISDPNTGNALPCIVNYFNFETGMMMFMS